MEGVSANMYKKMTELWRRRGYERLNGRSSRRLRRRTKVELGASRRGKLWGIKIKPKLKLVKKLASPKKLLVWLRDAYVKMMMGFANSRMLGASFGGDAVGAFGKGPLKEYDERMIIEIYKSLVMAQGHLVPGDAPRFGSNLPTLAAIVE